MRRCLFALLVGLALVFTAPAYATESTPEPEPTEAPVIPQQRPPADDAAPEPDVGAADAGGSSVIVDAPTENVQGNSPSDPDGLENGGADKPGGSGGVDHSDQDGNNGSGNDADCEDDNNGVGVPGHCGEQVPPPEDTPEGDCPPAVTGSSSDGGGECPPVEECPDGVTASSTGECPPPPEECTGDTGQCPPPETCEDGSPMPESGECPVEQPPGDDCPNDDHSDGECDCPPENGGGTPPADNSGGNDSGDVIVVEGGSAQAEAFAIAPPSSGTVGTVFTPSSTPVSSGLSSAGYDTGVTVLPNTGNDVDWRLTAGGAGATLLGGLLLLRRRLVRG